MRRHALNISLGALMFTTIHEMASSVLKFKGTETTLQRDWLDSSNQSLIFSVPAESGTFTAVPFSKITLASRSLSTMIDFIGFSFDDFALFW